MKNYLIKDKPKAIFLMGHTASEKTDLSIFLCKKLPLEIISADSALIYIGMDIGTNKPSREILNKIPHHLIDILDPSENYSSAMFFHDVKKKMKEITISGRIPIVVGGTMLYFKILSSGLYKLPSANYSLRMKIYEKANILGWDKLYQELKNIDPISANKIHPNDHKRIVRALEIFYISGKNLTEIKNQSLKEKLEYQIFQFAISPINKKMLFQKIKNRFYKMLNLGLEEEVANIFSRSDIHSNMPSMNCIGYKQIWSYLSGNISYDNMIMKVIYSTMHLAKHQITWLKSWPNIIWLDINKPKEALISDILKIVKL